MGNTEAFAIEQGCKTAAVNTMSFQARPFYETHGYVVMSAQEHHPKTSRRYYLEKDLNHG